MSKSTIKVNDNGPYELKGNFEIVDANGDHIQTENAVSLCYCGYSHHKPFCDGTHEEINFKSEVRANDIMVEV